MRYVFLVFAWGAAFFMLFYGFVEQMSFSRSNAQRLFEKYQPGAEDLYRWAREDHLIKGNINNARRLYIMALKRNCLHIPSWLGLCELEMDRGAQKAARILLNYVQKITANTNGWRWPKTLLSYQLEERQVFASCASSILKDNAAQKREVLQLADNLWPNPAHIIKAIGAQYGIELLKLYLAEKNIEKSLLVWQELKRQHLDSREEALNLIEMLKNNKHLLEASHFWRAYFPSDDLLYNGSFEKDFLQKGFGWKTYEGQASQISIVSCGRENKKRCLHIKFPGRVNRSLFLISQIVPLAPGKKYRFKGMAMSRNLTTEQRPYWQINGYQCKGLYKRTDMVSPSQEWKEFSVEFKVPGQCQAVNIILRRNKSRFFAGSIAGDLWLYGLALEQIGG